jgi:hypothetical protein
MPEYIATAGQTYLPFLENIHVDTLPYTPLKNPGLPELELTQKAKDAGIELTAQSQHFLPGVTAEMIDWHWANMDKTYYLWAPGSHKRFNWVKEPWRVGFINSVHCISEAVGKDNPVFGGSGVEIHRQPLSYYPFTTHLSHVLCEGIYNAKGEWVDSTIHIWEDVEGGCVHYAASAVNSKCSMPPQFIFEMLEADPNQKIVPPASTDHEEYEAARWPEFLPQLFELWKNHPDPSQNVQCNLEVRELADGSLEYTHENGPVVW